MKIEKVEIYSDASNFAVMRHPGRNFPGSLIQGDSLNILLKSVKVAKSEIELGNIKDASESLDLIIETLSDRLDIYIEALRENGRKLPFSI